MDAYLTRISSGWLIFWLWTALSLLGALRDHISGALADALGLTAFFLISLAYPVVLVFTSPATDASFGLQVFVGTSLVVLAGAMGAILGLEDRARSDLASALGIVATLCVQLGAALALSRAERRLGLAGGVLSALSSLFFLPVLGFLVHRR